MPQKPKNARDVHDIVKRVSYPDNDFHIGPLGDDGFYIQIQYTEADIHTGEPARQKGRKFYVSPYATESEIVQTCLAAALASAEHKVREHFAYRPADSDQGIFHPRLPYGPHFDVNALWGIATGEYEDRREPPEPRPVSTQDPA